MKLRKQATLRGKGASVVTVVLLSTLALLGCDVGREFRAAALPQLSEGVTQVVNGLLDGIFAAIEVEPDADATAG